MIDNLTDDFIVKEDSCFLQGESSLIPKIWIDFDPIFSGLVQERTVDSIPTIDVIQLTKTQLKELHEKLGKIIEENKL